MGRQGRRHKHLLDNRKEVVKLLEFESGSIRSLSLKSLLFKRLWICPKKDYIMNE